MDVATRTLVHAEVQRVLALMPRERGPRGYRGFEGRDADPETIREEVVKAVASVPVVKGDVGLRGPKGEDGAPGKDGKDGSPAQLPLHADFERDLYTHLTLVVHVGFTGDRKLDIVPIRDDDGFMVAADFLPT